MKNKFLHKFETSKKKLDKMAIAGATALATLSPVPVFAQQTWGYSGMNSAGIMSGLKNFVIGLAQFLGGAWAIIALFTLALAVRNEDNEGRNKAAFNMVAGITLLAFGTVVNCIGLSSGMSINSSTPRLIAGNVVTVLGNMMTYAGGAMIILGVFQYVMAIAQEQSEAVQKASTIIGIGIGLLSVGRVTSSLAVKIKANTLTGTYAVDTVIDFISGLATFVGGGMVLMAILKFVYSIRTEDSQDRSKSLLLMVSGLGLISFRVIMKMVKG